MSSPIRKRKRKSTSCLPCRIKKTRCNRQYPCSHCTKAGLNCEYEQGEVFEEAKSDDSDAAEIPKTEIQELRSQIRGLRTEVMYLKAKIGGSENIPTPFDQKLPKLKRTVIGIKPSRTWFVGPLSSFGLVMPRPLFMNTMSALKKTLDEERRAWKQVHKRKRYSLQLWGDDIDEEDITSALERVVDYSAFQEGLLYFQKNLNDLLYSNFMPMDVIYSLFLTYFQQRDGVVQFKRPLKRYLYADVSLIILIVHSALIFAKFNTDEQFTSASSMDPDELVSLAIKLLNLSDFRRKKTHESLLSIILLRSSFFIHDNDNDGLSSYPIFQLCLDLCYQMGLHRRPDEISCYIFRDKSIMKSRMMTSEQISQLWMYMQAEDAAYSTAMGLPLLINYAFCSGLEGPQLKGVMLMREIAQEVNSVKEISINDVTKLIDKVILFCSRIPFKVFTSQTGDLDELAKVCRMKLQLLQVLQCLCRIVILTLSGLCKAEGATSLKFQSLSRDMYNKSVIAAAVSLHHVKNILEGNSVFGNGRYIVYFRDILTKCMSQSSTVWFTFMLARASKNTEIISELPNHPAFKDYPPPDDVNHPPVDLTELENSLYHTRNNSSIDHCQRIVSRLVSLSELMKFAPSFCNVAYQHKAMKDCLDSYMTLRNLTMWMNILQTLEESREGFLSGKINIADIIEKTRQKVEAGFNMDSVVEFNTEGLELEQLFESFLREQNLFEGEEIDAATMENYDVEMK
ncbi:DEKNAAC104781 [Brettanomyces naardenensis]|uniref:DEKNAAC104781 n=1 Tax=Brettanomyces naardenensis TaxID=13370 RepID=A0A448YRT5_BRENA|nr:DEKNAAC104781 [Brettanomyces naardenensis]